MQFQVAEIRKEEWIMVALDSLSTETQRYYCSTPAIVPLLNVLVCSKSLGFTTRRSCLFYMIWLHLHDNGVASWEDIAINSSWDGMHNCICARRRQLQEAKLTLYNNVRKTKIKSVFCELTKVRWKH